MEWKSSRDRSFRWKKRNRKTPLSKFGLGEVHRRNTDNVYSIHFDLLKKGKGSDSRASVFKFICTNKIFTPPPSLLSSPALRPTSYAFTTGSTGSRYLNVW